MKESVEFFSQQLYFSGSNPMNKSLFATAIFFFKMFERLRKSVFRVNK